jgi:plastocyanin
MRRQRLLTVSLVCLALAAAVALAGCATSTPTPAPPAGGTGGAAGGATGAAGGKAVTMSGFAFNPAELEVKVGTAVTWTNEDSAAHTVVADDGSFKSGDIAQGQSFSFTFTKAGTFQYKCTVHPSMVGQIIVK